MSHTHLSTKKHLEAKMVVHRITKMSTRSSLRGSTSQNPALTTVSASPGRLCVLWICHRSGRSARCWIPKSHKQRRKLTIQDPERRSSYCILNQIRREIAEAEATAQFEGQTNSHNAKTDKEHGCNPDISLLVQPRIAALGVSTCGQIKSMIICQLLEYHFKHLLAVLPE